MSSSLIQVSVRMHRSRLLWTNSSCMSCVLFTTDLQLINAQCKSFIGAEDTGDCSLEQLFIVLIRSRLS